MTITGERPLPPQPPPITEMLAEQAARYGDRPLAIFDDHTLSYRDLAVESRRIAAALQARGVVKGELVMMMLGNRSEFLTTFFAIAHLGAISVPVNVALKGESLAHLFEVTKARTVVLEAEYVARVREAVNPGGPLDRWIIVGAEGSNLDTGLRPFAALAEAGAAFEPVQVGRADPCTILFTSGTTGVAKGVVLPHQQLSSVVWDAVRDLELDESSVFYTFNPLFHLNGLVFGPLGAMLAGGRAVVRYAFPRDHTLEDLRATGATHWAAVPYLMRGFLAASPRPDDADNALRLVLTIGMTEPEVAEFERRFGCRVGSGYGATETGAVCRFQCERPTSAGHVSDRHELRIVDAAGRDLPRGEVGEIWARARQPFDRMLGYYGMPEATAAAYSGEWFRTGDLAWLDQDGYLHFADRLKESLKRRGENISTHEVEKVLMGFPGVTTAAVVGHRPAPDAEEEVRAFIEIGDRAGRDGFDYAGLIEHCARHLAYFMVPRFIDLVSELPRTSLGKIQKNQLQALPLSASTFDLRTSGITVAR